MNHWLTLGYLGKETGNFTLKHPEEPVFTMDKIIKFLDLEKEKGKVAVDSKLIWQGSSKLKTEKIKKIWEKISVKKISWQELKPPFNELMELGEGLLPITFDIKYEDLEISAVDGEYYFIIGSNNKTKLKKLNKAFNDIDKRIKPILTSNI